MKISMILGDITKQSVDVIVNAANTSLLGGGGVDGAIHRAAGTTLLEECRAIRNKQGGCKVGQAVITNAGNLPAKYVIHTVGPVWVGGGNQERELLASCYQQSLILAEQYNVASIAFPNISTGIYRFPKQIAAEIAIQSVLNYVEQGTKIAEILFVCFDQENAKIYQQLLNKEH